MKWFFRSLFILIGVIILIPVLLILMTLDSAKAPVAVYREEESRGFTSSEVFSGSMDHFLADSANNDLMVQLTQNEINTIIYQTLKKDNPNYLIDDTEANKYYQVIDGGEVQAGVVGVWTKLQDDTITLKARVDLTKPVKVGTSVSIKFKIKFNVPDNPRLMQLKVVQTKIGNLPLPRELVNKVADQAGVNLKEKIDSFLVINEVTIGTFDEETWIATIDKIDMVGALMPGTGQSAMRTLVKILTFNELLDIKVDKSKIQLKLDSSKLYLNETLDHVPELERIRTEAEKDAMLHSKGTTMLLSALYSLNNELYINLSELQINKLLDYYLSGQNLNRSFKIGDANYNLNISVPTIDIYPAGMHLNIQMEFYDPLKPTEKFITTFKVEMVLLQENRDLKFEVGRLRIGDNVTLSADETRDLLELFGASEMVRNNMLVINNFLSSFASTRIEAKRHETHEARLTLVFQGSTQADNSIIGGIQEAIGGALGGVTSGDPTVQALIDEIAATPPGEITPQQVQALMDTVDRMTPEQIQQIETQLIAILGPEQAAVLLAGSGTPPTP